MVLYLELDTKFWKADKQGNTVTITYGKIGAKGVTQVKEFDTDEEYQKFINKTLGGKLKKGYVQKVAPAEVATSQEPKKAKAGAKRKAPAASKKTTNASPAKAKATKKAKATSSSSSTSADLFSGKKFCLTGKLSQLTRAEAKTKIEDAGGKVMAAISKNVAVVVCGEGAGAKAEKAQQLDLEIWSEDQLIAALNGDDIDSDENDEQKKGGEEQDFKQAVMEVMNKQKADDIPTFTSVFDFYDVRRRSDEEEDTFGLGGDPTLSVKKMPRASQDDVIQCLGVALAAFKNGRDHYPSFEENLDKLETENTGINMKWGQSDKVEELLYYFVRDFEGDIKTDYLPKMNIDEKIEAWFVCTAWENGCCFSGLLVGTEHVFLITYTNG